MLDFRLRRYHMWVPTSFSYFCMGISYRPRNTQSTWNNPMWTAYLPSLLDDFHCVWAGMVCLLVERLCVRVCQNFINFLQNHVAIGSTDLFDGRYVYFSASDSDTLHFFSIWWLVISAKDKNLFSTICAEDCSRVSDVCYVAIIVDNKANDQTASGSEEFLVSCVFLVGWENFIVCFKDYFSKSRLRIFQK